MKKSLGIFLLSSLLTAGLAAAQSNNQPESRPEKATGNSVTLNVTFNSPHDVFQFRVTSSGASSVKIDTRDCCISGDVWSFRAIDLSNGKSVDLRSQGNGSTSSFTGAATVYKNGSQSLDILIEVRYKQGIADFPAGMSVRATASPGTGTVTTSIPSGLVPLPSS